MTLFWQALRQQRLALVIWAGALWMMCLAVVSNLAAIAGTDVTAFFAGLPPAMRQLISMELFLQRPVDGYLNNKLFMYLPLLVSIYAAFQAAGLVAREVERRQMDFVLSLPVSRRQLIWARMQAIWAGSALLWAATMVALAVALPAGGYDGDWIGYLLVAWTGMLLSGAVAALAMWAGAGASEYRRALRSGLWLAVVLFLGNMALQMLEAPLGWRWLLLYGFYDPEALLLTHRFPWAGTVVLALVAAVAAQAAVRAFERREV